MRVAQSKVGVAVVNWNSSSLLKRCAEAVSKQTEHISQLILVDNGNQNLSQDIPSQTNAIAEHIGLKIGFKQRLWGFETYFAMKAVASYQFFNLWQIA